MAVALALSPSPSAINNNNNPLALHPDSPSYFDTHVNDDDHQYQHSLPTSPKQITDLDPFDVNKTSLQRPQPAVITPNRPILSRSLTMSAEIATVSSECTSSLDPAPGSPPDLSSSKSSLKSASLQSSPSNDDLSDTSHFEEISLTDLHSSKSHPTKGHAMKPRPALRAAYTTQATPTRQARTTNNVRDLTGGLRATATLNNHAQKHSPRMSWQRSFAPTSPSLSIPLRFGSRTPSPTKSPAMSTSPVSPRMTTPRPGNENAPILKHGSSQSKRKTQQELEDEYHDSDDELPDDAFIWNIPLSPRPQQSRSPSISPERGSLKARPGDRGLRFTRTKSWTAALSDLSEDAKKLTEALEKHYDLQNIKETSSSPTSSTASSPRPSLNARSKTINLPALQRGDPLIDPLPASKEKEKFLTRTRPSWLPPKCPKEEAKHLKEYQRMMSLQTQTAESNKKPAPAAKRAGIFSLWKSPDVSVTLVGTSSEGEEVRKGDQLPTTIKQEESVASEPESSTDASGVSTVETQPTHDEATLQKIYAATSTLFQTKLPALHTHLHTQLHGHLTEIFHAIYLSLLSETRKNPTCYDVFLADDANAVDAEKRWSALIVGSLSVVEDQLYVDEEALLALVSSKGKGGDSAEVWDVLKDSGSVVGTAKGLMFGSEVEKGEAEVKEEVKGERAPHEEEAVVEPSLALGVGLGLGIQVPLHE